MPRKHHQKWTHIKPAPATSSLPAASPSSSSSSTPTTSVNTLLSRLRNSQSRYHDSDPNPTAVLPPVTPSVPPNLQHLLGTPLPPPPPARPRITIAPRNRRTPGPPPPASWFSPPVPTTTATTTTLTRRSRFPLPPLPEADSLTHLTLKAIAREYEFHMTWDKYYLPLLPPRVKSLLLLYLPSPITPTRLFALFPVEGEEEEVTHLSLPHCSPAALIPVFRPPAEGTEVGESWESAPVAASARFPQLTHLSLARPAVDDGKGLLRLLELTPRLSHLSLAGWEKAVMEKVLRGTVKRLLCLRWFEVDARVVDILQEEPAAWTGAWRGVETVVLVGAEELMAKGFERAVRVMRKRDGKGAWFEVLVG